MHTEDPIKKIDYRVEIDAVIDAFFSDSVAKASILNPHYATLWNALHKLIKSGGKRLRPKMTLLSYEAFGGLDTKVIVPIAAAQELLHLSMLIHDDIIDRDYVRYGVDNISGIYKNLYLSLVANSEDRTHYADSAALLAGDLLISASYQMINSAEVIPQKIIAVQRLLGESIFEVAGGELLDTESAFRQAGEIDPETIAYYKTASYTFVGPLLTGAVLAHASKNDQIQLRTFAENLGVAYQFTDDLISIFGDEKKTGKSTTSDIREGKRTYLIDTFYTYASTDDKISLEKYFGKNTLTNEQAEFVRALLISSGAKEKTEEAIESHVIKAREALDKLTLEEIYHLRMDTLITTATKREY